jgi:hypothetical protein
MHLSHRGYAVRLMLDNREVSTSSAIDGVPSDDPSGLLLDALAVAEPDREMSVHSLTAAVRHASDGLLVMVLGEVDVDTADKLARARHGMGTTVAVCLDTRTWSDTKSLARTDEAWSLLRAAGWSVVTLSRHGSLADTWSHVAFGERLVNAPEVPA